MNRAAEIADLLRQAKFATTLNEQREFVRQAEELKSEQHTAAFSGDWSEEDARIHDTLVPAPVHELHTAATDWILDLDESVDPRKASQAMVAEASLWFGRVDDDVKIYAGEYTEQARNLARRLAGQYGDAADVAERAFLDEASRLRTTALRSGLFVEAGDAGQTPPNAQGPAQKKYVRETEADVNREKDGDTKSFDNAVDLKRASFNPADDLFAVLAASDGNEVTGSPGYYQDAGPLGSSRAPAFQELNSDSQDVVPANDPGLGKTDDLTGANAASIKPQDHASKTSFPVQGNKKESSMARYASCPTCGGHGKVAVRERELPQIEDIAKVGVSGLDQIDQTVDPHDNGPKATPYPADVAFPWVMDPASQVPNAIDQAEEAIANRDSLSPLLQRQTRSPAMPAGGAGRGNGATAPTGPRRAATRRQAGGRDNSGWIGDDGARGTDYPGEQVGQYPAPSTSEGYQDPIYGQGGEQGNRPNLPYGHMESDDFTNNQGQNWQPGQPTQDDNGWREVVQSNQALASAAAFLEQHRQAYLRNGG
jgi:hypothetical protein